MSSRPNSWPSIGFDARSVPPACAVMAAPPKIANHTRVTVLGIRMTPETNSLMVRPRLIRAMNMPTNGVQEIHQAQ